MAAQKAPSYPALCAAHGVKPSRALAALLPADVGVLRRLDLSRTFVGAKQCTVLGHLLQAMCALEYLNVAGNDAGDAFIHALSDALSLQPVTALPKLATVDLGGGQFTVAAEEALLSALERSPQVTSVALDGALISDGAVGRIQLQLDVNRQVATRAKPTTTAGVAPPRKEGKSAGGAPECLVESCEWLTNAGDFEAAEQRMKELEPYLEVITEGEADNAGGGPSSPSAAGGPGSPSGPGMVTAADTEFSAATGAAVAELAARLNGLRPGEPFGRPLDAIVADLMRRATEHQCGGDDGAPLRFIDPEFPPAPSSLVSGCRRPTVEAPGELEELAAAPAPFPLDGRQVVWRRLTDLPEATAPVAVTSLSTLAVVPSRVSADLWLTNAMCVAAVSPGARVALSALCPRGYPELGVFVVHLRVSDLVVPVVVDDLVPCCAATGEPLCAHSADPNELWPALVEKAAAKLYGGYDRLSRGSLATGIGMLIGGHCSKRTWQLDEARGAISSGAFFDYIHHRLRTQGGAATLACVAEASGPTQRQALRAAGLAPNRAYVIDHARQLNGFQVLRLRQPEPGLRWRGRFGPDSEETEEAAAELMWGGEDAAATHTWMTIEDVAAFFGSLYTIEQPVGSEDAQRAITATFVGQCVDDSNGGVLGRDPLWTESPTVVVRVSRKNTAVTLVLTQHDQRLRRGRPLEYGSAMQLVVLATPRGHGGSPAGSPAGSPSRGGVVAPPAADGSGSPGWRGEAADRDMRAADRHIRDAQRAARNPATVAGPQSGTEGHGSGPIVGRRRDWDTRRDVLHKTQLARSREVVAELLFQPGFDYTVVSTCAGTSGALLRLKATSLSCFTARPVVDNDIRATVRGRWVGASAGGAAFDGEAEGRHVVAVPTGTRNPQYRIEAKRNGQRVTILLSQKAHGPDRAGGAQRHFPIGFCVAPGVSAYGDLRLLGTKRAAAMGYSDAGSIAATLELDAGPYIVVPCTLLAGQETEFDLFVFSDVAVNLTRVNI